jgi:hypothetical protein
MFSILLWDPIPKFDVHSSMFPRLQDLQSTLLPLGFSSTLPHVYGSMVLFAKTRDSTNRCTCPLSRPGLQI